MKKRWITLCVSSLLIALSLTTISALGACSTEGKSPAASQSANANNTSGGGNAVKTDEGTFSYETELLSKAEDKSYGYNNNLFYVNNLEFKIADPSVIYINEGENKGWFYAYGTSDDIGSHGFQVWRSKDLSHWESRGIALRPEAWAINCYWAPEVIYDDGMYYMFFNAFNLSDQNRPWLSVAVSESPDGPFVQPSGVRNYYGKLVGDTDHPLFDFTSANPEVIAASEDFKSSHNGSAFAFVKESCIDASPFIDPVTKDKYLYFSYYDNYGEGSFIYGVKMLDWYTPDYRSLTMLTYPGFNTAENGVNSAFGEGVRLSEGSVNEGPFMVYKDGKYYLTFSVFGYTDPNYQVKQAIGDSPLGAFEKVSPDDGGKVVSSDIVNWAHIASAGHHCFINVGDEVFIAYHTFKNRNDISGGRALALDRVEWMENSEGTPVMFTNGPSWSVQPLPESISGYKNIAASAEITASNTAKGSSADLLNDGLIKYQDLDLVEEYEANAGESVITLSWKDFKTARAIMIYNSYDYDKTFVLISSIKIDYLTASGKTKTLEITELPFDWDWHFEDDYEFMRPGGAAIAEFHDLPVNKITVTINTPKGADALALGEIVVLGKDSPVEGVSVFSDYSFTPTRYGSPKMVRESVKLGTVVGTTLETEYGYDLSHDDGTENAFVTQDSPGDQSCYFKDVYSTEFYVEAFFSTTSDTPFAYNNYKSDPYPKFGLSVSCDDDMKNTIFYYVDAVDFRNKAVGVAQRMLDNSDWDWNSTEQVVSVNDMEYNSGEFVKLAILRQGAQFFFLCNDSVVISYNTFNVFNAKQKAGVGFRCFSTPMIIRDYYASSDPDVIAEKTKLYTVGLIGENFGNMGMFVTTSGWNLSEDHGEHPTAVQSLGGDQYAVFKGVNGTDFYAETKITVTKDLSDPYPKFGLSAINVANELFFYIDGTDGYKAKNVGFVCRNEANDWLWNDEEQTAPIDGLEYFNGAFATLGVLRRGDKFTYFVNGNVAFEISGVRGFGENDPCVISVLSFTTGITVKDYFVTTDASLFPVEE